MTRKNVLEAYRNDNWHEEYAASSVIVPTMKLWLSVIFPPSMATLSVPPHPVVFFARTQQVLLSETERVEPGFSYEHPTATLTVDMPVVNAEYAISWVPSD